jgi:hypothetical protein
MIQITIKMLVQMLRQYLDGKCEFKTIRQLVFSYCYAEDDISIDDSTEELFSVFVPYLLSEEAFGYDNHDLRMQRLVRLIDTTRESIANVAAFAIDYDEIQALLQKRQAGYIPESVLYQQIQKISPADLDVELLLLWARRHQGQSEPVREMLQESAS